MKKVKLLRWFLNLFKSKPKWYEDWVAEYHKIKDTAIMKDISICLMGSGGYEIINEGKPMYLIQPATIPVFSGGTIIHKRLKMTKSECCKRCVVYYRERVEQRQEDTVVSKI